jgi:GNAT acetyltransferase-like protein
MEVEQIPTVLAASPSLRVIEIDPQTDLRWEAWLANASACPSPIYHPGWIKVREKAYGYKPMHLACENANGQLTGILPLFYRQRRGSKRVLSSALTGPLADNDQTKAALVQAAVEKARTELGAWLSLKVMSNALDGLVEGLVGVPAYNEYLLALPERPDLLHLKSSVKRAVNTATKSGVQIRQAQTEAELYAWYKLYLQTVRKFVVMPNSYRFYKEAWQRLHPRGLLRLFLAEQVEAGRRRLLGGLFTLWYGQVVSITSVGSRWEDQGLRPNDALYWQVMQDACAEGLRWCDLGDVGLENQGLAKYKRKWGAEEIMVYDYSYPPSHDRRSSTQLPSRSPAYQLKCAVWQHLPINAIELLSSCYHGLRHLSL